MSKSKWIRGSAGLAAVLLIWSGAALAQNYQTPASPTPGNHTPANCDSKTSTPGGAKAPEKIHGQVTSVAPDQGKLTMRDTDGTTREFHAPKEILQQYKVGDQIQATLRPGQNCKPNA